MSATVSTPQMSSAMSGNALPVQSREGDDMLTVRCIEVSDRNSRRLQGMTNLSESEISSVSRTVTVPADATVDALKEALLSLGSAPTKAASADSTAEEDRKYNKSILQVFAVRRPLVERLTTAVMDADEDNDAIVQKLGLDAQSQQFGGEVVAVPNGMPVAELRESGQFTSQGTDLVLLYCYERNKMGIDCKSLCGCCLALTCCAACCAACCYCCSSATGGNGNKVQSNNPYPQKPNNGQPVYYQGGGQQAQNPMQPGNY